jgi:hypothetical protein
MDWDDLDSSSYRDTLSYNACIADTWSYLLVIVVKIRLIPHLMYLVNQETDSSGLCFLRGGGFLECSGWTVMQRACR